MWSGPSRLSGAGSDHAGDVLQVVVRVVGGVLEDTDGRLAPAPDGTEPPAAADALAGHAPARLQQGRPPLDARAGGAVLRAPDDGQRERPRVVGLRLTRGESRQPR